MDRNVLENAINLHRAGRLSEAERLYRELLDFDLLHMFGVLRAQQGHSQEALDLMGAALQAARRSASGLSDRGEVLISVGRLEEAIAHFDAALAISPKSARIMTMRGNALERMGRLEEALKAYDAALTVEPNLAQTLNDRGSALYSLGRFSDALASYEHALRIAPTFAQAFGNKGQTLLRTGRLEEAVHDFDRALELMPLDPAALTNRGVALRELRCLEAALASFVKAYTVEPRYANAYYNAACLKLLIGDFAEGWNLYEWRKQLPIPTDRDRCPVPTWSGKEPLIGKTIFLFNDQGLGDCIQFIRYAVLARETGARVVVSVNDGLRRLLAHSLPDIEIVGQHVEPERFDYQAALMSLPLAFETALDTIPHCRRYLRAEPQLVESWRSRIGCDGFRVGIAWQGRPDTLADIERSVPLHHFARLARIPGIRLISLQKEFGLAQLSELPSGTVETLSDELDADGRAFVDTAAIIENLDLVISSDTAIAHLAGAVGRPVWLALRHVPEWRWLLDRGDSPWYPSMTLFRQKSRGDWSSVFQAMHETLEAQLCAN